MCVPFELLFLSPCGTDYAFFNDVLGWGEDSNFIENFKENPTALLTSCADTISVGDSIHSITPGIHILAGGSGADTYAGRWLPGKMEPQPHLA